MSLDVLIVGGGFTGTALAGALSARGARIQVCEATQSTVEAFRGELIHPRGVRALERLGMKEALFAAGAVPVTGFAVTPGAGREAVRLPYAEERGVGLGMAHATLVLTMRRRLEEQFGLTVALGQQVTDFLREGDRVVGVVLADGTAMRANLVVVADGRASKLRRALGIEPAVRLLSYTLVVRVRADLLPHAGHGHVFLGAPGPILAYPYGDGFARVCIDVPVGLASGREGLSAAVHDAYAPALPEGLRAELLSAFDEQPLELCATHAISTTACAAPGVALVGDAAGCGHPLTASGLTNALHDVETLAALLERDGATDRALEQYQRLRYDFIRMRELLTDALYEVFRGHDEGSKSLQGGIFRYWNGSARARTASMELLSGEELRTSRFVAEYSRVFGLSALDLMQGPKLGETSKRLRALLTTSVGRMEDAVGRTARKVVDRYRMKLHRGPPGAAP